MLGQYRFENCRSAVKLSALFLLLGLVTACNKGGLARPDDLKAEHLIWTGYCEPDCSLRRFQFHITPEKGPRSPLVIEIDEDGDRGFRYCAQYQGTEVCDDSSHSWRQISSATLFRPCPANGESFLIKFTRGSADRAGRYELPSYWMGLRGHEISLVEDVTPDTLMPMFACTDE